MTEQDVSTGVSGTDDLRAATLSANDNALPALKEQLSQQLSAEPRNAHVLAKLAAVNIELGNYEEALDESNRLTELAPQMVRALRLRAHALDSLGRQADAAQSWETYLATNPVLEDVIHLSKIYQSLGLDKLPLTALASRIGLGQPSNANPAIFGLLLSYLERGDEAEAFILGVLTNPPKTARFAAMASWVMSKQGRYALSRRMTEWAISLRPMFNPERGQNDKPHVLVVASIPRSGCFTGEIFLWNNFYAGPNYPTFLKPTHFNIDYTFDFKLSYALLGTPGLVEALSGDERPDVVLGNFSPEADEEICAQFDKLASDLGATPLNGPAAARSVQRDLNWERFRDQSDFVFPKTLRFTHPGDDVEPFLGQIREKFELPIILRPTDTHWGKGAVKCESEEDIRTYLQNYRMAEVLAIQFYDYKQDWDDRFVTYRCAWVKGELLPITMIRNSGWLIQGQDHELGSLEFRKKFLVDDKRHREEEELFMTDMEAAIGGRAVRALKWASEATGLDIVGTDFSFLPDGRVIIFEINANMLLTFQRARSRDKGWEFFKQPERENLAAIEKSFLDAAKKARKARGVQAVEVIEAE